MTFLCLLALLYFLPTILASNRGLEVAPILLLNLFFGWTVIGWFALLVGILLSSPPCPMVPPPSAYYHDGYWRR
jgi:Superinfection immunity protein